MLSTVRSIEKNKATLDIEIEKEKVKEGFQKVYQDLSRQAKVPGFRAGKIPRHILINFVGKSAISQGVVEKLLPDAISGAIKENNIEAISLPQIAKIEEIKEDEAFKFTVEVEVKPQVKQIQYKNLVMKKKTLDINEIQIEKQLQLLREKKAILLPVEDRGIKEGDVVFLDYSVTVGGEELPSLRGEGIEAEIGKGNFLKEIEDKILGAKESEERKVEVKMKDDFPQPEIAGKEVEFQVKIVSIKQKQLPDLDSEFAKEVGCNNITDLKEKIKEGLKKEAEYREREDLKKQIIDVLLETTPVDKSETLINYEREKIINNLMTNLRLQGLNPDDYIKDGKPKDENTQKEIEEAAERNAKLFLILDNIAKEEGITATEEETAEEVERIARQLQMSPVQVKNYLEMQGKIFQVQKDIVREKVFDLIIDSSKSLYVEGDENL